MHAVEDMVQSLIDALDAAGELDNTYFVLSSDNGFHMGQHRLPAGKNTAFEEDLRVPLVVRGPGVSRGLRGDQLTANIDYAPTFSDWAGVETSASMDGRSWAPLLRDDPEAAWRTAVLLEHQGPDDAVDPELVPSPDGIYEPPDSENPANPSVFVGVRTDRYTYVEYIDGERELYDNMLDPDQLDNLASSPPPGVVEALQLQLAGLRTCRGRECE